VGAPSMPRRSWGINAEPLQMTDNPKASLRTGLRGERGRRMK